MTQRDKIEQMELGILKNGRRTLQLEKGKDREFFVAWLENILQSAHTHSNQYMIQALDTQLLMLKTVDDIRFQNLGNKITYVDKKVIPSLDSKDYVENRFTLQPEFFLSEIVKLHLWTFDGNSSYHGEGTNQSGDFEFTHNEWRQQIFNTVMGDINPRPYQHIILANNHFHEVFELQTDWFRSRFDQAVNNLCVNIIESVLPNVATTCRHLDFSDKEISEQIITPKF